MTLTPELVCILACPVCRGGLEVTGATEGLVCSRCAVVYPVRDEIPVMLAEEAIPAREWAAGKRESSPGLPKSS